MKTYTTAALAGLGLALAGCSTPGQQAAALCEVSQGLSLVQEAQFITNDPVCVVGRASFINQCQSTGALIDANAAEHAEFDAAARAAQTRDSAPAQTQTQVQIPDQTSGGNE